MASIGERLVRGALKPAKAVGTANRALKVHKALRGTSIGALNKRKRLDKLSRMSRNPKKRK